MSLKKQPLICQKWAVARPRLRALTAFPREHLLLIHRETVVFIIEREKLLRVYRILIEDLREAIKEPFALLRGVEDQGQGDWLIRIVGKAMRCETRDVNHGAGFGFGAGFAVLHGQRAV